MTNKPSTKKLQKIISETQQLLDKCANPDSLDVEIHANCLIQAITELLAHRKFVAWIKTDLSGELSHTPALNDVIAERQRQISVEGWTPEHDDNYKNKGVGVDPFSLLLYSTHPKDVSDIRRKKDSGLSTEDAINQIIQERGPGIQEQREGSMAVAAACYARIGGMWNDNWQVPYTAIDTPSDWPWSHKWWKLTSPRRDLVKAAALILAEIERLDRAALANEAGEIK